MPASTNSVPRSNSDSKGFFKKLFARHGARPSATGPAPHGPKAQDDKLSNHIEAQFAGLNRALASPQIADEKAKAKIEASRDLLQHQYRKALVAYRQADSSQQAADVLRVISNHTAKLEAQIWNVVASSAPPNTNRPGQAPSDTGESNPYDPLPIDANAYDLLPVDPLASDGSPGGPNPYGVRVPADPPILSETASPAKKGHKHPPVDATSSPYGFSPKKRGAEYANETEANGFRAGKPPSEEASTLTHELYSILESSPVGRLSEGGWDQTKLDQHEIKATADGTICNKVGNDIAVQGAPYMNYVVDPQSGTTHLVNIDRKTLRRLSEDEKKDLKAKLHRIDALEQALRNDLSAKELSDEQQTAVDKLRQLHAQLPADSPGEELKNQIRDLEQILDGIAPEIGVNARQLKQDLRYLAGVRRRLASTLQADSIEVLAYHSTPLGGRPVAGAGTLTLEQAKITEISNSSGHYKPEFVHLAQTIEHLMREGALLDKTMTYLDESGEIRNLDDNVNLKKLRDSLPGQLAGVARMQSEMRALAETLANLAEDAREVEGAELASQLDQMLQESLRQVEAASETIDIMRKLGVAPANRASVTKVRFHDVPGGGAMTGLEFKLNEDIVKDFDALDEFMQSGGNHEVPVKEMQTLDSGLTIPVDTSERKPLSELRQEMLAQIKEESRGTRAHFDAAAERRSKALLKRLKGTYSAEEYDRLYGARMPTDEEICAILESLGVRMEDAEESILEPAPRIGDVPPGADGYVPDSAFADPGSQIGRIGDMPADPDRYVLQSAVPDLAAKQDPGIFAYSEDNVREGDGNLQNESPANKTAQRSESPTERRASEQSPGKAQHGEIPLEQRPSLGTSQYGELPLEHRPDQPSTGKTDENRPRPPQPGSPRPANYAKLVEERTGGKIKTISGSGMNCYIRALLTGLQGKWRPKESQTLESCVADIDGKVRQAGIRATDGLIDAGGADGKFVRGLIEDLTGFDLGLRIISWDRINAKVAEYDVTNGSVRIVLVHTEGHFDLLI